MAVTPFFKIPLGEVATNVPARRNFGHLRGVFLIVAQAEWRKRS
jgi:hypothetical protein